SKLWFSESSLPKRPLKKWNITEDFISHELINSQVSVIYGRSENPCDLFKLYKHSILLGLDIFGSAFFMLTRYEEFVRLDRDQLDRFPATASLAYQEGFLHRPIVDEYVEILWACMKKLWPGLDRRPREFQTHVSHDVDIPYQYAFTGLPLLTRNLAGDLLKRRTPRQGLSRIHTWRRVKQGNLAVDPFNTFDWIMSLSEKYGLTSAFYFITGHTNPRKDGNYSIRHLLIRQLLRRIYQRGHEIGIHPSFNTYQDSVQTQKEFGILQQVCSEEGIQQSTWGGRQHFLRWCNPTTWQNWEVAGLSYDSTLSFADAAGFRCGTCHEFPVFDLATRQTLNLIERPLIVMECTVLDQRYMGLGQNIEDAFDYIKCLKDTCRQFNGNFTMLWHNHRFASSAERELYEQVLKT
ncbi:MAG: polysaccharide deacetylase family protein, partial [Cyanobacteria bacterium P01_A01_bin.137]